MKPKRIQRKREKGWKVPKGAIYVGRPTRWGNPWRVGIDGDPAHCVALYREELVSYGYLSNEELSELRGKDLMCWCPLDQQCHADVLLEIANKE